MSHASHATLFQAHKSNTYNNTAPCKIWSFGCRLSWLSKNTVSLNHPSHSDENYTMLTFKYQNRPFHLNTQSKWAGGPECLLLGLTGGMNAGEAFAALRHQVRVTCAVHLWIHYPIWKAAVKEIGARSTKDTMDIFNIQHCHHNEPQALPSSPHNLPVRTPPLSSSTGVP